MPSSPPTAATPSQPGDAFEGASADWVKEIIRQGELRLQAQLQSALAADARAGVLASIQAAVVAALVVFGGSDEVRGAEEAAAYSAAALTFLGAVLAGIAARPIGFDFPGLAPLDWAEAVQTKEPEDSANRAYAQYLDDYIKANDDRMKINGWFTRAALVAMVLAPAAAVIALAVA
ncbi:hypothetical protein D3C85_777210 [compost metagenome]